MSTNKTHHVGVVLGDLGDMNGYALRYLLLHLNTLQDRLEFELLQLPKTNPLAKEQLCAGDKKDHDFFQHRVDGTKCDLYVDCVEQLSNDCDAHQVDMDASPEVTVAVTMARSESNHYAYEDERYGRGALLVLGDWPKIMAPPSVQEFTVVMVVASALRLIKRQSTGEGISHVPTRGCLFDFTANLGEARFKALNRSVCTACRCSFEDAGLGATVNDVTAALRDDWLGDPAEHTSAATITRKLGHDLFITSGIKPSFTERFRTAATDELARQAVGTAATIVGTVLLIVMSVYFGIELSK